MHEFFMRCRPGRQLRQSSESDISLAANCFTIGSTHILTPHSVPHLLVLSRFVNVTALIPSKLKIHDSLFSSLQAASRGWFTTKLSSQQSRIESNEPPSPDQRQFVLVSAYPTFGAVKQERSFAHGD